MAFLKELVILFLVAVIFVAGFSVYVCFTYARPRRFVSPTTPASFGLEPYENIEFETDDGVKLRGWYIPAEARSDKAIIICHGYPMDKGNVVDIATAFNKKFNVLLFDFRGMGQSEGLTALGYKETMDFDAAVSFLKGRGLRRIGAFGLSMGGAVIIMANNPDISAVVSDSSFADLNGMVDTVYGNFSVFRHPFVYATKLAARMIFGINISEVSPVNAIKDFKADLLIIHSKRDSEIDVKNAYLLHEAYPKSEMWLPSSPEHGQTYYMHTEEYKEKIYAFFKTRL